MVDGNYMQGVYAGHRNGPLSILIIVLTKPQHCNIIYGWNNWKPCRIEHSPTIYTSLLHDDFHQNGYLNPILKGEY